MSHVVWTDGIFYGTKTGTKKNSSTGEQWVGLQFKTPQIHLGATIAPQALTVPSLMIFPDEDFDYRTLEPGKTYSLQLSVYVRRGGSSPEFSLLKYTPKT